MQIRQGGRGNRALYANKTGRAVGRARGEVELARCMQMRRTMTNVEPELAPLCKFRRAMQIKREVSDGEGTGDRSSRRHLALCNRDGR